MNKQFSLEQFYDSYPRIGEEFQADLDQTLSPRGPDFLFQLVDDLSLDPRTSALDVGCGEGRDTFRLADQFGVFATGVDPVARHISIAEQTLKAEHPPLAGRVAFQPGRAEALPVDDAAVDLVWCRDVLSHVGAIDSA